MYIVYLKRYTRATIRGEQIKKTKKKKENAAYIYRRRDIMYRIFSDERRRALLVRRPTVIKDRYAPILVRDCFSFK